MDGSNRAVFFDKDGTLLVDVPHNVDPRRMRWAEGARAAISRLHREGWRLVVVSNQAGVARGLHPEGALVAVRRRLESMFTQAGAKLDGFYYCPHDVEGRVKRFAFTCECRKPNPGLVRRACRELGIDADRSWLVGDILDDVETGQRSGCKTILLDVGHETVWKWGLLREPHAVARDVREAVDLILSAPR